MKGRVDVNHELDITMDIIEGFTLRKRRVKRKIISAESSRHITRAGVTRRTIVVIK